MAEIDIEKIVDSVVCAIEAQTKGGQTHPTPGAATRDVPLNQRDDVRHVALGSVPSAAANRDAVGAYLQSLGYHVVSVDADDAAERVNMAVTVARKVAGGECERGIVLDADGICASIACNKVKGIRAALCYDMRSVVNSREHSHANIMTVGGPFHNNAELCEMVKVWLELRFSGGSRWATINKIMATERR